jgi:hypothetical protein
MKGRWRRMAGDFIVAARCRLRQAIKELKRGGRSYWSGGDGHRLIFRTREEEN